MLQLTAKVGEKFHIEGVGEIIVLHKSGQMVKLGFDTDKGPITIRKPGAVFPRPLEPAK